MTDSGESTPKKPDTLVRSSLVVSSMTLVSRVMGLVRDVCLAVVLGAAANADAFFVAFKIPNFFRRLFAEGAFSQAFVPVLGEYQIKGGREGMRHLADRVAAALGGSLLVFVSLAILGAPLVSMVFAPGFHSDPAKSSLTADLIRITFPYLFFISLTGFAGALLNSLGRFAIPAFTPVLLNLSLIGAAVLFAPSMAEPAYALAWGVFVAGLAQLLFQIPSLMRLGVMPRPHWDMQDRGVRKVLKLMVPALFGVSVSQINLLLDTVIASFLPTGSVSWLYFSDRLVEFPLGVFGIAIATVILPSLSRKHAGEDTEAFAGTMDWAVRCVLLIGIPAMVALVILAKPLLVTIFMYGKMTANDVTMAAYSLQAYSLGLLAFMLVKVLAPGYFSRQDTTTPVRIGIIAMVANMVMNIAFVVPLYYLFNLGHLGLALATSLAAYLNAGLLWRGLHRSGAYRFLPGFGAMLLRVVIAASAMGLVLLALGNGMEFWAGLHWWQRALQVGVICLAGLATYAGVLLVLGVRPRQFRAGL
jgi:putative peptidoglycan lipid II flippase